MEVTLIYFSQTGNTRKVAKAMAGALREAGHPVRTISLKKATPEDLTRCELLGFGTPCQASMAPTPVKEFLRTIPTLDDQRAFVFATYAGAPGRVLYDMTSLLRKKAVDVIGGFLSLGKVSHPAPAMIGRFPDHPDVNDLNDARNFALAVVEHVSIGRSGALPESRLDALMPGWGLYDIAALFTTDGAMRRVMSEPKADLSKCDHCKWCVHECPMDNITLQPDPVIGNKCIRCYRCLTGCPQDAFTANWIVGNLYLSALYNPTFTRWFGDVDPDKRIYG
jgi:flavodoxin/NAD-dependent dihydropyrimidine dehydrogenase PreA subunit